MQTSLQLKHIHLAASLIKRWTSGFNGTISDVEEQVLINFGLRYAMYCCSCLHSWFIVRTKKSNQSWAIKCKISSILNVNTWGFIKLCITE